MLNKEDLKLSAQVYGVLSKFAFMLASDSPKYKALQNSCAGQMFEEAVDKWNKGMIPKNRLDTMIAAIANLTGSNYWIDYPEDFEEVVEWVDGGPVKPDEYDLGDENCTCCDDCGCCDDCDNEDDYYDYDDEYADECRKNEDEESFSRDDVLDIVKAAIKIAGHLADEKAKDDIDSKSIRIHFDNN